MSGYDQPVYVLPFDRRATFTKNMFGWEEPPPGPVRWSAGSCASPTMTGRLWYSWLSDGKCSHQPGKTTTTSATSWSQSRRVRPSRVHPDSPPHTLALEKQGNNHRRSAGRARSNGSQVSPDQLGTAIALSLPVIGSHVQDAHRGEFALGPGRPQRAIFMTDVDTLIRRINQEVEVDVASDTA